MIALLFFLIAIPSAWSAITHFRHANQDSEDLFRAAIAAAFGALMLYFGVTSFLRARRISRSS